MSALLKCEVAHARSILRGGVTDQAIRAQASATLARYNRELREQKFYSIGLTANGTPRKLRRTGIKAASRREYFKIWNGLFGK